MTLLNSNLPKNTVVVKLGETICNNCGNVAYPDREETHTIIDPNNPMLKGCGTTWKYVATPNTSLEKFVLDKYSHLQAVDPNPRIS